VYEKGDVTVLWNQAVHIDREFTAKRSDIVIKITKVETCTLIDVAIPADRNVVPKEGSSYNIQVFMYRDRANMEPEIYDHNSNYWIHWDSNEKLKEKFGKHSVDSILQTAILGTSHIIRRYCSVKLES